MAPKNPESQIANPTQVGERANSHQVAHEQAGLALSHEANNLSLAGPGGNRSSVDASNVGSNLPKDTASSYLPSADSLLSGLSSSDSSSASAGRRTEASNRAGEGNDNNQSRPTVDRQSDNRQGAFEAYDEKAPTGFSPAVNSLEQTSSSKTGEQYRGSDLSRSATSTSPDFMRSVTSTESSEGRVSQIIGSRSGSDVPAFTASIERADSRTTASVDSTRTDELHLERAEQPKTKPAETRPSPLSHPASKPSESLKSQVSRPAAKPAESRVAQPTVKPAESRVSQVSQPTVKPAESRVSQVSQPTVKPAESRVSQVSQPTVKPAESRVSQVPQPTAKPAESRVSQVSPSAKPAESHVAQPPHLTASSTSRGQESSQKANHPEQAHVANHPEQAHVANHPDQAHVANHPDQAHVANHPDQAHVANHPEQAHVANHPKQAHVANHPDQAHVANHPEQAHVANHPEQAHVANHPEQAHVANHPEQAHVANHPEQAHVANHPEQAHVANHPEQAHVANHPEQAHVANHPEQAHVANHPDQAHVANHPEQAHVANHPEQAHVSNHPETAHVANHAETIHAANHPETAHAANHPEPTHGANHSEVAHAVNHAELGQPATAARSEATLTDASMHSETVSAGAHPESLHAAAGHSDAAHATTVHAGAVTQVEGGQSAQRSLTSPDSRRLSQVGSAPSIDKSAQKEELESTSKTMSGNQQLRTSQMMESERDQESSRKISANKERQSRVDDEEDRADFGKKGALANTEGSRGKERSFTRGEGGDSLTSFSRNVDGSTMGAMDQKTSGRLSGSVSADQSLQQNNMLQTDGSRFDFGVNSAGNIVNLRDGKVEGVSSQFRHAGGAESSGKVGSDAPSISSETSKTSTGMTNGQGSTDLSNLLTQAPADRSIFSGTSNNQAGLATSLQATTGGHNRSSKNGHSSKEPGVSQTDPSSANNMGGALNAGQVMSSLGIQNHGNASATQHKSGQEPGQANGANSSTSADAKNGVVCNGAANTPGQHNQTGQPDPGGQNNPAGKNDPVAQTHPGGQTNPLGQVSPTGQPNPITQTNPIGSTNPVARNNPNGSVDPSGHNPKGGEPEHCGQPGDVAQSNRDGGTCVPVCGGDQSGQYGQSGYGWSDSSGHNLVGMLGSILVGLGEGLGAGHGHINNIGSGIPVEYGAGNLSQFNKSPGTIHVGDNAQPESSNVGQVSTNPQSPIVESVQTPGERPQTIVSQPPETVITINSSGAAGSASADKSTQASDPGSQTIDSSTYVGGSSTGEGSSVGHPPGIAGDGSSESGGLGNAGGSPLKGSIQYDAADDPAGSGSSPNGVVSDFAPNEGADPFKFGNLNPLIDPADSSNLANPNANTVGANPNSGNQIVSDPNDFQVPNATDPINNQIQFSGLSDPLDPINGNQNIGQVPTNSGIGVDDYQLPDGSNPLLAYGSIPVPDWADNLVVPDPGLPSTTDWQSPQTPDEKEHRGGRHSSAWDSEKQFGSPDDSQGHVRKEIAHSEYQDDDYLNGVQRSEIVTDNVGGASMPDDAASYFGINENAEIENDIRKRQEEVDLNRRLEQDRIHKEDEQKKANIVSQNQAAQRDHEEQEEQAKQLLALMQAQEEQARKDSQQSRYLVKRGDTLEKIAQVVFQDVSLVSLIYALNKRLIVKQMVDGLTVYLLKENTVLLLPSLRMVREWRQTRRFSLSIKENTSGSANVLAENETAKQRRLNIEKFLGPIGSAMTSAERLCVGVRLGDTLRSIAMKHPELEDINLWPLLAQCNSLSTAVDNKGVPVAQLKRGTSLLLPTQGEIADYRMRLLHATQPDAPRNALKAVVKRSQNNSIEEDSLISESDFELAICETVNLSLAPEQILAFRTVTLSRNWANHVA